MEKKTSAPGLAGLTRMARGKRLRVGYTTGTCAAAAALGAARALLLGKEEEAVSLTVPAGQVLTLPLSDLTGGGDWACCAVQKDAGDDPDVTDEILVYARVERTEGEGLSLQGGEGVGRATLPGLSVPVGEAAINPVPRREILRVVKETAEEAGYEGGLRITITIPGGEEIAKRTMNPRLGIVGGLSVLGTTGLVEPMSEKALVESIRQEMGQKARLFGGPLLLVPGAYGERFAREQLHLPARLPVLCSNYIGEAMDIGTEIGARGLLFVGSLGKLVKLAGGIMNTHSHQADCRMEILCAAAVRSGGSLALARALLSCATTEEGLRLIEEEGCLPRVMEDLTAHMDLYLSQHSYGKVRAGAIVFSESRGYLGQTREAGRLLEEIRRGLTAVPCGPSGPDDGR